jgi:DNA-damage-inducible protein D
MENDKLALFEGKQVRKVFYKNDWWFSIIDVVSVLSDSKDPKQYIKKMRSRDPDLNSYWGTFCTPLEMSSFSGKKRRVTCSSAAGIFRIIQSIPSPKAEPFKQWLAQVGHERIQEIENPELAMDRMKAIYEKKGYPKDWIDKRARGIAVRHTLTDEWKTRGVKRSIDFAILTNEIMKSGFGLTVSEYKDLKGLKRENLRDHMDDIELILTMLGEASTTKFTQERDSQEIPKLKKDAQDGGHVAKVARIEIESQSSKSVISPHNYLNLKSMKLLK